MMLFVDYYFYFDKTVQKQGPYFNINSQSVSYPCYSFYVVKDPFAGVNAYPDLITTPVYLYNQDWINDNNVLKLYVISEDDFLTADKIHYFVYKGWNAGVSGDYYATLNDLKSADLVFSETSSSALSMCNQFSWKRGVSSFTAYSAKTAPINVYKTVADMKKDIGSQVIGGYTSDYTGKCAPSVSVEVINNIDSGGSGGGSGGSDDSGGGSSGSGIFDDIISGIANGVGSIIKGIFSIFKDLVDAIADAIVSITKSITDLMGLLKGDFTSFLSAVFPFMPQEFITIMVASLALCLLGVIIKIFRG